MKPPPPKTPPFGLRRQSATIDMIVERITEVERDAKERGERLARVETKQDFTIEMLAEMRREQYAEREARSLIAETQKTERVRLGGKSKIATAAIGAAGAAVVAIVGALAGLL